MSSLEKFQHSYHTYERSKVNRRIYRCIHPDCMHYMDKAYLLGKRAECPKCHELYILTAPNLRHKRPTCVMCSKSPKAQELREAKKLANNALDDMVLPDDIRSILE